ncbi:hypothetical protein ES704_00489 [subsurface metagenome]|jgi:SAM-dependent methyltransferase
MSNLYDNPKYYEIAFSFRDIPAEVDVFEECFKRFSQIPVKSVLEVGCGNSPHMEELVKRSYQYNGLDLSKAMLEYSRQKASRISAEVNLIHGNMVDFSLDMLVDFVYVTLGSLYVTSTSELITHFDSVAQASKKGGLYLLDWCIQYDPLKSKGDSWEIERDSIQVKTTVSWELANRVEQTFEETITLEVNDHGEKLNIVGKDIKRAIYPQEFLLLIEKTKKFEFVGWWNNWDINEPIERAKKIERPLILVRRI